MKPRFHIHTSLWRDRSPALTYGLALLMAIMVMAGIFPLPFLLGKGAWFYQGDAAQNVAGWLAFAKDGWHFPLLKTQLINSPVGTNIVFTDSIPLAALLFKPLYPWLPENFHYFGYWFALAYVLQALGANFLIRSFGVRNLPGTLFAVAFALIWPAFTNRAGHVALSTHGLLLFSIGLYLRSHAGVIAPSAARSWSLALSCIALLVHPYLFAMGYPFYVALLLDQKLRGTYRWSVQLAWLLGSLLLVLVILYAGGYLTATMAVAGYGDYSTNILAPFCGGYLCDTQDATGWQSFEGFNYFGAGFLALLPVSVVMALRDWESIRVRKEFLFIAMVSAFALFAISNKAYLGNVLLYQVPLPEVISAHIGAFRASGRFFWVVGYACLFLVLSFLLRKRSNGLLAVMLLALVAQWLDTGKLREEVTRRAVVGEGGMTGVIERAARGATEINLYPSFGCSRAGPNDYIPYQVFAARQGIPINTAYTARIDAHCENDRSKFDVEMKPGQVFVYLGAGGTSGPFTVPPKAFTQAARRGQCVNSEGHVVCSSVLSGTEPVGLPTGSGVTSYTWSARDLPTVVGRKEGRYLITRKGDKEGFLSYGPYVDLPPGIYSVEIRYSSPDGVGKKVGRMQFGRYAGRDHDIVSGDIQGSHGELRSISRQASLEDFLKQSEIRIYSLGNSEITLESVSIRRLQDDAH